jgi:tyrosinase
MSYLRKSAYNNGGTFENTDLLWYAKAVAVMKSKPITDPTSWWFYAAIHGEFITEENMKKNKRRPYLNWPNLSPSYIPAAAIATLPADDVIAKFWNQCQHSTWYFGPWHRGYLTAIEVILRDIISNQLGGPSDWSLPYWNYMKLPENKIPPAFTTPTLKDGSLNPLFVPQRYGTEVEVGAGEEGANDACQLDTAFTAYGGGETDPLFAHFGNAAGDLESNPHNYVHGMVGGENSDQHIGIMGSVPAAALDPIFYLHHANIDRMWSAWIVTGDNDNPNKDTEPDWAAGPQSQGNSMFVMPASNGESWYYTPADVEATTNVQYFGNTYSYSYDDLSLTSYTKAPVVTLQESLAMRLTKLNVDGLNLGKKIKVSMKKDTDLVGASKGVLNLKSGITETTAQLDKRSWNTVKRSLENASIDKVPDQVFLQLEDVRGVHETNFLSVYVNEIFVKTVSLFGIELASRVDNPHGGSGLTFRFNITNIVDDLHLGNNIDVDTLNIQIKTKHPIHHGDEITIGRIGIYRLDQ